MRNWLRLAAASAIALGTLIASPAMAQERYIAEIFATGANFCPRDTLPADGRILPIRDNPALFSLIGTRYGGDGRSTFALPDLSEALVASTPSSGTAKVQYCVVTKGMFPTRR